MRRSLRIHSHSHAGCTWLRLSAGGKKSTYVHEGPLHLPTTAHLPCFISFRGKKLRRILFEQASYIACLVCMLDVRVVTYFWVQQPHCKDIFDTCWDWHLLHLGSVTMCHWFYPSGHLASLVAGTLSFCSTLASTQTPAIHRQVFNIHFLFYLFML
jgi:hypothetical protein